SFFIFYLLQTPRFMSIANLSSGTKMPRSDWRITSNSYFAVSNNFHEESKIGRFFNQLVKMVELHQRKIIKLLKIQQQFSKALLVKSSDDNSVLRFKYFHSQWGLYKLSELSPLRGGYAFKSNEFQNDGVP